VVGYCEVTVLIQVHIRPAVEADIPTLLEIYNDVVLNSAAIYEEKGRTLDEHREWYRAKLASGHPLFVAELDGTVIGYCSYGQFRNWTCYRHTVELSLYVDKKLRGKGVGSQMLQALIADARQRGFHSMIAGVDATNISSIQLHEKMGFIKVAHLTQVGFKFNRWLDLVLLQLVLDPAPPLLS